MSSPMDFSKSSMRLPISSSAPKLRFFYELGFVRQGLYDIAFQTVFYHAIDPYCQHIFDILCKDIRSHKAPIITVEV
jgi:hypothetical protein